MAAIARQANRPPDAPSPGFHSRVRDRTPVFTFALRSESVMEKAFAKG